MTIAVIAVVIAVAAAKVDAIAMVGANAGAMAGGTSAVIAFSTACADICADIIGICIAICHGFISKGSFFGAAIQIFHLSYVSTDCKSTEKSARYGGIIAAIPLFISFFSAL